MLFSGLAGAGQPETALWLARALFCRKAKNGEPCGECGDCRLAEQRTHPDLVWLTPEGDSRTIKVEEVRAVISRSGLRPLQAPAKLFVIEPADALSDIGQNAFLKTLEEPEGHTYFVLISYADEKILSTVRSRTQQLRFSGAGVPVFSEDLENTERSITDLLLGRPGAKPPDLGDFSREELLTVLEAVAGRVREALLIGVGAENILGGGSHSREEELAGRWDRDELIARLETLGAFKEKIAQNVNVKLILAALWENLT